MIRILLSLAVAAAAFFGPWLLDSTGNIVGGNGSTVFFGQDFAGPTVDCVKNGVIGFDGACEPNEGILGKLVAATIAIGVVSGALSILGLLPLIGRLTSLVTVISGAVAVIAVAWFLKEVMMTDGAAISDLRWGAIATGLFGILTVFAGLAGLSGDRD